MDCGCLENTRLGAVTISANTSTIVDANHVFEVIIKQLEENGSDQSKRLLEIFPQRFEERRNEMRLEILFFLIPM